MNYYRRYVGDFQRDTGHLSLTEVGAYDRLLDHYYATEKPLPASIEVLCRIARAVTAEERRAVQAVADEFFPMAGEVRRNKRAEHEITVSQKARDNGKKGGRPETGGETGTITGSGTGQGTGEGGGSGHPPTTNLQPPATSPQPPSARARKARPAGAFARPDWIDAEAWDGFEAMRTRIRKPMTDRARQLIVAELERLRAAGHDPRAVLDQSTRKSWQDVYPIKTDGAPQQQRGRQAALEAANAEAGRRFEESRE